MFVAFPFWKKTGSRISWGARYLNKATRERERGEGVLTCVHIRTYVKNVLFELIDGHFMCGCRNLKFYRARCRMRATEPRKEECAISRHDFHSEIQMHEAGEACVHRETVCSVADYIVCDVKLMYFI